MNRTVRLELPNAGGAFARRRAGRAGARHRVRRRPPGRRASAPVGAGRGGRGHGCARDRRGGRAGDARPRVHGDAGRRLGRPCNGAPWAPRRRADARRGRAARPAGIALSRRRCLTRGTTAHIGDRTPTKTPTHDDDPCDDLEPGPLRKPSTATRSSCGMPSWCARLRAATRPRTFVRGHRPERLHRPDPGRRPVRPEPGSAAPCLRRPHDRGRDGCISSATAAGRFASRARSRR